MKRALVIQRSKFGDVAQTLPALSALRQQHPDWEIWVLGRGRYVSLLERFEGVDRVISTGSDCAAASPEALELCAQDIVRQLPEGQWELVANLSHDPVAGRVATLLAARERAGLLVDGKGERSLAGEAIRYLFGAVGARRLARIHLSDIYRWALGVQTEPVAFPLLGEHAEDAESVRAKLAASGVDLSRKLVLFQLGTAAPERRWPVHLFARLGRMLAAFPDIQIALIGSEEERALGEAYHQLAPGTAADLIGQIPVQELPALARLASVLIGADTGPTHIAAAVGSTTIGLYHATAWVHETGPYGRGHVVLQADLHCSPCFQRTACAEKPCATSVQPEHVFQALVWKGIVPEDEVPAEFMNAPWTQVRAFVSEMRPTGVLFRQVAGNSAEREEVLAAACREGAYRLWFPSSGRGTGDSARAATGEGASFLLEMKELLELADLAGQGASFAHRILRSVRHVSGMGKKLPELARKLDEVDERIRQLGPGVELIRSYLTESQKLLSGGNVAAMAAQSEKAYSAAAKWARFAAEWLKQRFSEQEDTARVEEKSEQEAVAAVQ